MHYLTRDIENGISERDINIFDHIAKKTIEDMENSYFTVNDIKGMFETVPETSIESFVLKMRDIGIFVKAGEKRICIDLGWE